MQCEGRKVSFSTNNYYKSNSRNKGPNKSMCKKTIKVRKAGLGAVDVFVGGYDKKRASPIHAMARVRQVITRQIREDLGRVTSGWIYFKVQATTS